MDFLFSSGLRREDPRVTALAWHEEQAVKLLNAFLDADRVAIERALKERDAMLMSKEESDIVAGHNIISYAQQHSEIWKPADAPLGISFKDT